MCLIIIMATNAHIVVPVWGIPMCKCECLRMHFCICHRLCSAHGESPSANSFLKIKSMLPWKIKLFSFAPIRRAVTAGCVTVCVCVCLSVPHSQWMSDCYVCIATKNCAIKNFYLFGVLSALMVLMCAPRKHMLNEWMNEWSTEQQPWQRADAYSNHSRIHTHTFIFVCIWHAANVARV